MLRPLIGPKIRDRRVALGITQSSLASRVGISASYLNLIEGNKRNVAGALLKRIAQELDLRVESLDGAAERRLLDDLDELAGDPVLAEIRVDAASKSDFASRHVAWARALIHLHRLLRHRNQAVDALSDRLSHHPFLSDAVHSVSTRVAAIRSSAEIVESVDDLGPDKRRRFVSIIAAESRRLSDLAQALAAFFDKGHSDARPAMPVEEVDDFLFDHGNYFPALENAAEEFRRMADVEGECGERVFVEYLKRQYSVEVVACAASDPRVAHLAQYAVFDAVARTLLIADIAPPPTRRFELARVALELFTRGASVAAEVDASPMLSSDAARRRAWRVLSSYLAAATVLPYAAFHRAARDVRYDIEYLAQRFNASYEQVCHRLVTLKRPGAEGLPFGLVRIDAAGFVTKRFPLPRLPLPRHGNVCPVWALYAAFQTSGTTVRQLAEFPSGDRFLFIARTIEKPRASFAMPRRLMSIMLACDALHGEQTVYGRGLDLSSSAPAIPVGSNCRLCVRRECLYREEDPIIDA